MSADEQGVIFVPSGITQSSKLSDKEFCTWYEDVHVPDVIATGGVPAAARYQKITGSTSAYPNDQQVDFQWLTIYAFPSLKFRFGKEFAALDGPANPDNKWMDSIFANTVFDTRFSALVYSSQGTTTPIGQQKPSNYVVYLALKDVKTKSIVNALENTVSQLSGYKLSQIYEVRDASLLYEFDISAGLTSTILVVHFESKPRIEWILSSLDEVKQDQVVETGLLQTMKKFGSWA